jgi:hypothetical protein
VNGGRSGVDETKPILAEVVWSEGNRDIDTGHFLGLDRPEACPTLRIEE